MTGYLANYAFPRLGEVTRCGLLNRYEKIPFTQSFGTVLVERAVDLITLIFLFAITIYLQFDLIFDFAHTNVFVPLERKFFNLFHDKIMMVGMIATIILFVSLIFLMRKKIASHPLLKKIRGLFIGLWIGIKSVRNVKNPFLFIFHSIFIWAMYYLMIHVCFYAFKETNQLSIGAGLSILTFGSLGVIAAPGGIGAYQWIVDRKSTRLNSSHIQKSRMPSSA